MTEAKDPHTKPTDEDLALLSWWPSHTVGFHKDLELTKAIRALCDKHGYGRIPQLAEQIKQLWEGGEEARQTFRAQRERMLPLMPTPEFFAEYDKQNKATELVRKGTMTRDKFHFAKFLFGSLTCLRPRSKRGPTLRAKRLILFVVLAFSLFLQTFAQQVKRPTDKELEEYEYDCWCHEMGEDEQECGGIPCSSMPVVCSDCCKMWPFDGKCTQECVYFEDTIEEVEFF